MTTYVLCKTLVPWLCPRSQQGIKVIIRGLWGHLLHTVTFLFFCGCFYLFIFIVSYDHNPADFLGRIQKHLADKEHNCGCIPRFYSILSSTGESVTENPKAPVTLSGRVEAPIIKNQAGTKSRPYYIYMYKYTFADDKVCIHLYFQFSIRMYTGSHSERYRFPEIRMQKKWQQ